MKRSISYGELLRSWSQELSTSSAWSSVVNIQVDDALSSSGINEAPRLYSVITRITESLDKVEEVKNTMNIPVGTYD